MPLTDLIAKPAVLDQPALVAKPAVVDAVLRDTLEVDPSRWQRPAEWLDLPEWGASEAIHVLHIVEPNELGMTNNYAHFYALGDYTVDWGDGVVESYPAGHCRHFYDFDGINSPLLATGEKQVIMTITPQSGHSLTNLTTFTDDPLYPERDQSASGWLDCQAWLPSGSVFYIGNSNFNNIRAGLYHYRLEQLKLHCPNLSWTSGRTLSGVFGLVRLELSEETGRVTSSGILGQHLSANYKLAEVEGLSFLTPTISDFAQSTPLTRLDWTADMFPDVLGSLNQLFGGKRLRDLDFLSGKKITGSMYRLLYYATVYSLPLADYTEVKSLQDFARNSHVVDCRHLVVGDSVTSLHRMYSSAYYVVYGGDIDCANLSDIGFAFSGALALKYIRLRNLGLSVSFYRTSLTRGTAIQLFHDLVPDVGGTITLTDTPAAGVLTAEDIQIATDKGWTVLI